MESVNTCDCLETRGATCRPDAACRAKADPRRPAPVFGRLVKRSKRHVVDDGRPVSTLGRSLRAADGLARQVCLYADAAVAPRRREARSKRRSKLENSGSHAELEAGTLVDVAEEAEMMNLTLFAIVAAQASIALLMRVIA